MPPRRARSRSRSPRAVLQDLKVEVGQLRAQIAMLEAGLLPGDDRCRCCRRHLQEVGESEDGLCFNCWLEPFNGRERRERRE